jgi:hypothetical protein
VSTELAAQREGLHWNATLTGASNALALLQHVRSAHFILPEMTRENLLGSLSIFVFAGSSSQTDFVISSFTSITTYYNTPATVLSNNLNESVKTATSQDD